MSTAYPLSTISSLRPLSSPVFYGTLLHWVSLLIAHPLFGRPLRRFLFNSNFALFLSLPPPSPVPPFPVRPSLPSLPALPPPSSSFSLSLLQHHLQARTFTPLSLIRACLLAVHHSILPPLCLNAIAHVDDSYSMSQARLSTIRLNENRPLSPLDGLPFIIKTNLDLPPFPTDACTGFDPSNLASEPAVSVQHLLDLGMICVGKANMDELGLGVKGFSKYTGQIINPYDRMRIPGGSSAGCAVAVAMGIVPVAIGTDSGGSVRIPAACCGVSGLKGTVGGVSTKGRFPGNAVEGDEVTIGPICASAGDLQVMQAALGGAWESGGAEEGVKGVRVGVCGEWMGEVVESVMMEIEKEGGVRKQVEVRGVEEGRLALMVELTGEMEQRINGREVGAEVAMKVAVGGTADSDMIEKARGVRGEVLKWCMEKIFGGEDYVDVWLLPAVEHIPNVVKDKTHGVVDVEMESEIMKYMTYANATGLPACVVPVGMDADGLPQSVQLIAKPWNEEMLTRVATWIEGKMSNKMRKAGGWFDIVKMATEIQEQQQDDEQV